MTNADDLQIVVNKTQRLTQNYYYKYKTYEFRRNI